MSEFRQQFNSAAFGINGTGKSKLGIDIAREMMENNPSKRALYILSNKAENKFRGMKEIKLFTDYLDLTEKEAKRLTIDDIDTRDIEALANFKGEAIIVCEEATLFDVLRVVFSSELVEGDPDTIIGMNGFILLDDCKDYLDARPNSVLRFMRRRRQMNADLLSTFHGFSAEMPRSFVNWLTHIQIFRVNTPIQSFLKLITEESHAEILQKFHNVQQLTKSGAEPPWYYEEVELQPVEF